jgi:hypothetical protein
MTPTAALGAVRDKIAAAAILPGGCNYPAEPTPPPRSGQVIWQGFELPDNLDEQLWTVRAAIDIVNPALNESTYPVSVVDALVVAVVDFFSPEKPANYFLETAGDRVEHCRVTGGNAVIVGNYYAHRVAIEIVLRRAFPT